MKTQIEYDDTYTGPRWRYGLTNRPVGYAAVPDGWILFSDRAHDDYRHGTIDYPFQIDTVTADGFEIALVGTIA